MTPRLEPSPYNVFAKYFEWFLENKYIQKLARTDEIKDKTQYIDYKNRILMNLRFQKMNNAKKKHEDQAQT
jgi:hypothetical protein